ncbi:hypothetical protein G6F18_008613 [Rhizopus arrhizus]|nr:hypothetical protein G6F18_008613 [Rhizopus arrhizus]
MFVKKLHLNSKWGMHYRIITDILVLQYPMWSLIDAFMSIFAELKGRYCEGVFSFKGAYVYLTIIDFVSLSIILTALFTYLDVFNEEWKKGLIRAHGMFWCVKGPIMVIFYLGDILLTLFTTTGVIKGTDGTHGSIAWPADAVKNGLYVIIICFVMLVASGMMAKYFNPEDNIETALRTGQKKKMNAFGAFAHAYLAYIPEFLYKTLCCGVDSYRLLRKRRELRKRRAREGSSSVATSDTNGLLRENSLQYKMNDMTTSPYNAYANPHYSPNEGNRYY